MSVELTGRLLCLQVVKGRRILGSRINLNSWQVEEFAWLDGVCKPMAGWDLIKPKSSV